jgi:hypothetical protein
VLAVLGLSGIGIVCLALTHNPGVSLASAPRPARATAPLETVPLTQPLLFEGFEAGFSPDDCSFRNNTEWCVDTKVFGTKQWQQTSLNYHSGNYSVYHQDTLENEVADSWLVTPLFTPTIDSELIFWQREVYPSFYQTHTLMISTQSGDPKDEDFTALVEHLGPGADRVWEPITISLSSYAGQPIFLAFQYQAAGEADVWYLDDVEITTDIVLTSDSPTPLGRATTMTASVAPGRDVSFAWDFGDSNFGSGTVVTHTYAAAGTYTVVVTASNSLTPTLTRSMQVTVQRQVYLPLVLRQ